MKIFFENDDNIFHLKIWFLGELAARCVGEVVIGERSVESGDEVEESLPVDGVAEVSFVLGAGAARV